MQRLAEERIRRLLDAADTRLLQGGKKGLEKESLRIARDGSIALTPHPNAWGSPLTHPYITTDYSEALPELITPPFPEIEQATGFLYDVHHFMYATLSPDELLWAASMPCAVGEDQGIPIAEYGSSNAGRMKHVYRVGLDYRYGRRMQAISGVHFNYSLPEAFWPVFQEEEEDAADLQSFIDESYFGLIRNFYRFGWLIPFLFGNSPVVCKSFLAGRTTRFKQFCRGTYYLPEATSLRMSDIGYKNKNQAALNISYNDLDSYVSSLRRAIRTPYPEYEAIGVKDGDEYIQLNTNILQIENEYYSFIRPKRTGQSGESPTTSLRDRGVEYVEVRALDVDPCSPIGVEVDVLRFAEAFLLYCLFESSPLITDAERRAIQYNELTVALRGRDGDAELHTGDGRRPIREWAEEICLGMQPICELLDNGSDEAAYAAALRKRVDAIRNPDDLPSARFLAELGDSGLPFADYTMQLSEQHEEHFKKRALSSDKAHQFGAWASESLARQEELERNDTYSFEEYLQRYFANEL
jgi:glutamate--cysteine ligase